MRGAAESTETAVATDSPARLPMSAPEDVAGVPTRNGSAASAASPASPAAATSVSVAAAFAELLSHGPSDPLTFEQALADLVRARRESRADLAAALSPVAVKGPTPQLIRDLPLATPLRQLHALAINAVWQPTPSRPYDGTFELAHLLRRLLLRLDRAPGMDPYALRSPADIITLRLAELAVRIGDPGPAELVSTPTHPDGWIDPDVLVARVSAAEQAGRQPWPLDFDQALLRLPDTAGPATMRAAHDLSSPAGHRLAGWLRGGRPTLPSAREMTTVAEPRAGSPRVHPLATVDPPPPTAPAPTTLIHLLRRGWYPPGPLADGSCWTVCWPTLLPGHPGLVAVAAAWHPRHPDANGALCPTPVLTRLATPTPAASDLGPPPNTTPGPGL
ncbi:MAG: DUF6493 family protein, partial [Actinocrinis sp.]